MVGSTKTKFVRRVPSLSAVPFGGKERVGEIVLLLEVRVNWYIDVLVCSVTQSHCVCLFCILPSKQKIVVVVYS